MGIQYLDGKRLYYAFISGAKEVVRKKKPLNQINVYPVPDGDTGSNLAATMCTIIEELKMERFAHETFQSMADASLTGARGNSGIIFAQFMNGIATELGEEKTISPSRFAESVEKAVEYAYQAIVNPVEGTMVTVIKDWAKAIKKLEKTTSDYGVLLEKALVEAKVSLADTPNKLKVLKDAAVVDAGAKGFVHFLDGIVEFIKNGKIKDVLNQHETIDLSFEEPKDEGLSKDIPFRYCTEALVTGNKLNAADIRQLIKDMGNSAIVAGSPTKVRIHIHTNEPAKLFEMIRPYGQIIQQKVDDMVMQYEIAHERKAQVAIVTDSVSDIPIDLREKHQIHVIPLSVNVDGSSYIDRVTIHSEQMNRYIDEAEEYPNSAQPTIKRIDNTFSYLSTHYDSIIAIMTSDKLSGTYSTTQTVAKKYQNDGYPITVINSKLNSVSQGLAVIKAAKAAIAGDSYEQIISMLENKIIPNTYVYVCVDTLKYFVKSGRISPMKGKIGKWLNLKPIVSMDKEGYGITLSKAFSHKGLTKKIAKIIQKMHKKTPVEQFALVHIDAPDYAKEYTELFSNMLGIEPTFVSPSTPAVALNAGKGCVAIALLCKKGII